MNKLLPSILGLALGSVQADFNVSAKANVITPDHRPAKRCAWRSPDPRSHRAKRIVERLPRSFYQSRD